MSRYDWGDTHPGIDRLKARITPARELVVSQGRHMLDGPGKVFDVVRLEQEPGLPLPHHFGDSADARANHGLATRISFENTKRSILIPF